MEILQLEIPPLPQFATIGHSVWKPGDLHYERRFNMYDLLLVMSGSLHMTEDGRPYDLRAGELLLLQPGLTHVGHRPSETDTEIYWVHFFHPMPPRAMNAAAVPWSEMLESGTDRDSEPRKQSMFLPKSISLDPAPLLPPLHAMLDTHRRLNQGNALSLHTHFAQLLSLLQNSVAARSKPSQAELLSRGMERFLFRYVSEPFLTKHLEREFHFNADYLARCLKRYTGKTPLQYVQVLKINEAKRLLTEGSLDLPEIADRVGIRDYNYFIRLFRRMTGTTPGEYRKSVQGLSR